MRGLRTLVGILGLALVLLVGYWIASWSVLASTAFVAFAGGIGTLGIAFAGKNSVDSLAGGGGIRGAKAALMTDAKPEGAPSPVPPVAP